MKLINTTTMKLEEFISDNPPPYAILSHTWEDGEVTFEDFKVPEACRHMSGFAKIQHTCQLARDCRIDYAWVDTCCINKDSSAELSEAINSMFQWYARSVVCYIYLSDLKPDDDDSPDRLDKCRWFTRGWTLQELIAPRRVEFYDKEWSLYSRKDGLCSMWAEISRITSVDESVLHDTSQLYSVPVGRRMSWAAKRKTTRVEDLAYCLLGIFGVNMPMLYGEGKKAFIRLQEEIARGSTDMTLFAWRAYEMNCKFIRQKHYDTIFAGSPAEFVDAGRILPKYDYRLNEEFTLTNKGLRISSLVGRASGGDEVLPLNCDIDGPGRPLGVGIYLKTYGPNMYARVRSHELALNWEYQEGGYERTIYISTKREQEVFSLPRPILFGRGFAVGDIAPIAPKTKWDSPAKGWITQESSFTGLAELTSEVFSDRVYILLHRLGKTSKPSVKLANQFLFGGVGISPSETGDPPLSMNQMLHDVVVFDKADTNKPVALLSVSITLGNDAETYIVDLVMDTSCIGSLPSRSDYRQEVRLERGYASEIMVPNRKPGTLTRRGANRWGN
jgi:hypothetical protein